MPLVLLISLVVAGVYLLMVLYFFIGWLRLKKAVSLLPDGELPFVTVIIPVRNECEHIAACLESVFAQHYPPQLFEVLVIDDYSIDGTLSYLKTVEHPGYQLLDLQKYLGAKGERVPNKKKAIALGVKNAKGDVIVTTDGDCTMGPQWLRTMVSGFVRGNFKLATAPVLPLATANPLTVFQQMDVAVLSGITGGTIRNGFPTMCNGANLIFSKEVFYEVEAYKGNDDIPTGDDVFLMQKTQQRYPGSIGYIKNRDAIVSTNAETTLGGFFSQRVRWVSKAQYFIDWRVTTILGFAYLFNLWIPASLLLAFEGEPDGWLPLAVAAGVKLAADFLFNLPVLYFFKRLWLILLLPVMEVAHVFYVILIGLAGSSRGYRWKDRSVKQ